MTLDITQAKYATTVDTFKNLPSETGTISVPNQSYTAGQFRTFTTTVDLEQTDASEQMLQNFSFDSAKYYVGTYVQLAVDANFLVQTRMSINGSTLTADAYVINNTGGTHSVPAFTIGLSVRRFLTPFN